MSGPVPTALVLAAGLSERMGAFKPLLPLGGIPALERVIRLFQRAGVADVRVVTGHRAGELAPVIAAAGATAVENLGYREGMFSSVRAGIASLVGPREPGEPEVGAVFLLPVDIPLIRLSTVRELAAALEGTDAGVLHPVFAGRRGHPPLIRRRRFEDILAWNGDGGLGGFFATVENDALDVAVADRFLHRDMDHPGDYEALRNEWAGRVRLSPEEAAALLDLRRVDGRIAAHCRAVADLTVEICRALNTAGHGLDAAAAEAAALVHDVARHLPEHAAEGARMLRDMDAPETAAIVAVHMDGRGNGDGPLTEAEIVFLADKLVAGTGRVSLEERFRKRLEAHPEETPAGDGVRSRLAAARRSLERIRAALGGSWPGCPEIR